MRLLLLASPSLVAALGLLPRLGRVPAPENHPGVPDAKVEWFQQRLDHFDFSERRTWQQQ